MAGLALHTRSALASDAEWAYDLFRRSVEDILRRQTGQWNDDTQRRFFFAHFPAPESRIILLNERPVGCYLIEERDDCIWLGRMYLDTASQGKGFGSRIVAEALERALTTGKPLQVEVLTENKDAQAFYRARGFIATGTTKYEVVMRHADTLAAPLPRAKLPVGFKKR